MLPNFVCAYPVSARIKILLAQCSDLDVVVNIASGRRSTYWCMAICAQITVAFIFAFHILVLFLFFFSFATYCSACYCLRVQARTTFHRRKMKQEAKNVWADRIGTT